jgi:hypothetical protein
MARKPDRLTPDQQDAIDRARRLRLAEVEQRDTVEREIAQLRKDRLSRIETGIEDAIEHAVNLDVSKLRIAREVFNHKTATEVYRTLERVKARRDRGDVAGSDFASTTRAGVRHDYFKLDEDGRVIVTYPGFPTQSTAPDYPAVLSGIVVRDETEPNNWRVIEDDSDETDARNYVTPGHLRWELDRFARPGDVLFSDLLSKWWEAAGHETLAPADLDEYNEEGDE